MSKQAALNFKCWKIIEKPFHYAIFFSQCDYKSAKSRNKFRELKKLLKDDSFQIHSFQIHFIELNE